MTTSDPVPTGNTYDKYGATNPFERRMMERFLSSLDDFVEAASPDSVLEIGAGEGYVATRVGELVPGVRLTVLDLPDPELKAQWDNVALSGVMGSADHLPYRDASVDLVMAVEVMEHLPDPAAALAEMARVSARHVLLSVPLEPVWRIGNVLRGRYVRDLGNTPGHIQHWSKGGFRRLVEDHLEVIDIRTPMPWTMLLARVR